MHEEAPAVFVLLEVWGRSPCFLQPTQEKEQRRETSWTQDIWVKTPHLAELRRFAVFNCKSGGGKKTGKVLDEEKWVIVLDYCFTKYFFFFLQRLMWMCPSAKADKTWTAHDNVWLEQISDQLYIHLLSCQWRWKWGFPPSRWWSGIKSWCSASRLCLWWDLVNNMKVVFRRSRWIMF